MPKATNTHSQYVIFIYFFPLQQWLHKRVSILLYTYTVCLVIHRIIQTYLHILLQDPKLQWFKNMCVLNKPIPHMVILSDQRVCAPDDYNTYVSCIETFWSPCRSIAFFKFQIFYITQINTLYVCIYIYIYIYIMKHPHITLSATVTHTFVWQLDSPSRP
jgi:hypothetical protein